MKNYSAIRSVIEVEDLMWFTELIKWKSCPGDSEVVETNLCDNMR